ncbi:MAG: DUF4394 domain-containing protein [Pyrinomonadaceae bacterium]
MYYRLLRSCSAIALLALMLGVGTFAPLGTLAQAKTSGNQNSTPQVATAGSTIYALATAPGLGAQPQRLVSFDFNSPGTLRTDMVISGLQAGEVLRGIDFRPATGQLFALGSSSRLYTLDPDTGVATQVGGGFAPAINSAFPYAFNFNPNPDRLRVIGSANQQNFRLNPNTGGTVDSDANTAGTQLDTNVAFASGDPNAGDLPNIVATAYNNNDNDPATPTTNYAIDPRGGGNVAAGTARLVTVGSVNGSPNSPNSGLLNTVATITDSTGTFIPTNNLVGFDIAQDNTAYVSLTPPTPFNSTSTLYTLNLSSGQATPLGTIGTGLRVSSISVAISNRSISTIQFASATATVAENGTNIALTVTRTGDTSGIATVDYQTNDQAEFVPCTQNTSGQANQRCDYSSMAGTLTFTATETSKTITIFITDDVFVEGNETFTVSLRNASGGVTLGAASTETITITDNDTTANTTTNPIDDTNFFVTQQYRDFLNREPDFGGFAYWTRQINQCGTDRDCLTRQRTDVSAAFFFEQEFQQTGSFIIRLYRAAFNRRPTYQEFIRDFGSLAGATSAADNAARQTAFDLSFTTRDEFRARFGTLSNNDFVDRLYQTAGITITDAQRTQIISDLNTGVKSRAQVLTDLIYNATFTARELKPTFVLTEYFGYLRRDPDEGGFQFWLSVLANDLSNYRVMVCAFLTSAEYQQRFGQAVTRTNSDCR